MSPSVSPPIAAPPGDPARAALGNPALHFQLEKQAKAFFQRYLAARPRSFQLDEAGEAIQDACKRALDKSAKFDPAKGSTDGWIHGILQVVCCERCRLLNVRHQQIPDNSAVWSSLEAKLDSDRNTEELSALMKELKDEDRQIVTWAYVEELSHIEIAEKLGISRGASRVRLSRALVALKHLASEKEGER